MLLQSEYKWKAILFLCALQFCLRVPALYAIPHVPSTVDAIIPERDALRGHWSMMVGPEWVGYYHLVQSELAETPQAARRVDRVFRHLRGVFLREYVPGASTQEVLESGRFNCLSGSALIGLASEALGWEVSFWESPSHIALIVFDGEHRYWIEATEEDFGAIRVSERFVKKGGNLIGWTELAGLQHFNLALVSMDQGELENALVEARQAHSLYPCTRTADLVLELERQMADAAALAFQKQAHEEAFHLFAILSQQADLQPLQVKQWSASALYLAGRSENLHEALEKLTQWSAAYPALASSPEFALSLTELRGTMALNSQDAK